MGGEQHAQMMTIGSRPSDKYDEQNRQVQQEIHDSLIFDLQDKERAIQQGSNVVQYMHTQNKLNIKSLVNNMAYTNYLSW